MRKVVWTLAVLALSAAPAAAQNPVSDSVRSQWNSVKAYYLKSAEQMPESNYGFKPTPDVRSFGQIIAHVAGANYLICAGAKGEKPPYAEDYFEKNATTKADIVKAATDSISYCDGAFSGATDANLADMLDTAFSKAKRARADVLILNIGHVNEHYGNLVTYFRLKGMVPPSSQTSGG